MSYPIVSLLLAAASVSAPSDWPSWRGPAGDGFATSKSAPIVWDSETNVKWRIPLANPANGSPIVIAGKVFLTMPEDEGGKRRSLYCYDRESGEELWAKTVEIDVAMPTHKSNPYCGTTPASDGRRVAVWHSSAGLYCYDLDGKELWSRELGDFRHMWGYGTSPVFHDGKVILNSGPGEQSFVAAFDAETGDTVWKTDEPNHLDAEAIAAKRIVGSWCTPVVTRVGERDLVICAQPTRIVAYDHEDGSIVWWCGGIPCEKGDLVYSSPMIADDVCFVVGGYEGPSIGVRMDGEGDVTETHRLWRFPKQKSNCGSGIFADGHFYVPDMHGFVACIDPETGKPKWNARAGRGAIWGSIVSAGGKLYVMNQRGTTVVFEPGSSGIAVIARNELAEETNSTPAIADGEIFLRTHASLWCIAEAD